MTEYEEIEQDRKEKERVNKLINRFCDLLLECDKDFELKQWESVEGKLEGFNLGVEMARKEILELMRDIKLSDTAESYSFRLRKKIEQSLEIKGNE